MDDLWILENVDTDEIIGDGELWIVRESVLTIELPNSPEPIVVKTILPRSSRRSSRSRGARAVEGYDDALAFELRSPVFSGGGSDGIGVKLTGINSEVYSEEDDFFLLIEPVPELIEYINLDYPITFRSENPLTDAAVFSNLLNNPDVRLTEVREIQLPTEPPEPIPESDPILGLGLIGVIGVGLILKGKLSRFFS